VRIVHLSVVIDDEGKSPEDIAKSLSWSMQAWAMRMDVFAGKLKPGDIWQLVGVPPGHACNVAVRTLSIAKEPATT
jgi:hypothetical protein